VFARKQDADDAVERLAARREHQQRQLARARIGAQLAAQVEPVAVGQHEVEQQGVERALVQQIATRRQRTRRRDVEAVGLQVVGHHRRQAGVVVDQQQARGRVRHGAEVFERVAPAAVDTASGALRCGLAYPLG
jgi:hypothetical protein